MNERSEVGPEESIDAPKISSKLGRTVRAATLAIALAVGAVGCGARSIGGRPNVTLDAGQDAGIDAAPDAGVDAAPDAETCWA